MWKVKCFDEEGRLCCYSYWPTLAEAKVNQEWLKENYGFEAQIEQVEEEA